jgi:hypothetical protein
VLIPAAPRINQAQGNLTKANCAGQGCPERGTCRRFQVRIVEPARGEWVQQHGLWVSADIERAIFGTCAHFVRFIGERRAA